MLTEDIAIELSKKFHEPPWLLKKRLDAFKKFKKLEMPSFKYGIGIFVDVSDLDLNQINPLDNLNNNKVINTDIEILSFREALQKHEALFKEYFMTKCVTPDENKFTALHAAFFNNCILIRIPENKSLTEPINISLNANSKSKFDHILIIADKNSSARIIENSYSQINDGQNFRSQVVEVIIKENARMEYITIQNLSKSVYNFCKRKAHVEQNGIIYWIDCSIGSKFTQSLTSTKLNGFGAESRSLGIIFGDTDQCFDIYSETEHAVSKTKCDMLTKVVLNDKAKTVYRGLIKINPNAINCEGYQKDDTILLSEDAKADVVPNLEICNNDVKCTHGATISQIDEDKLFYMMSRGLNKSDAKNAIIEGFFGPIILKINDNKIEKQIIESISKRLK